MRDGVLDVRAITAADLAALEPLLRASYRQDDFALEDELEVFAERKPRDWFALFSGQPRGFIRYFPLDENLYIGELYVVPGLERAGRLEQLLRHFIRHHELPAPTTLRLDVPQADYELTSVLKRLFPAVLTKTFAHFQLRTPPQINKSLSVLEPLTKNDLETIRAVLAQLKPYDAWELERLAHTGQLYVFTDNGVKAALHAAPHGAGLEVVTLATAPAHLRRGHAAALLKTFLNANPDTDVTLKVKVENTAAIKLYEHVGFTRQDSRTEVWWYLQLT